MRKLNNKGQSFVLFVLLLPIMLLIMVLVFDIGRLFILKQDLNNINYMVVSYGIKHYNDDNIENDIIELINLNCSNLSEIDVYVKDDKVRVNLVSNSSLLFNISFYDVSSYYIGDVGNNKIDRIK